MKKVIILVATALLSAVTISCQKDKVIKDKVIEVRLNKTELTLLIGDTTRLVATVLPEETKNKAVSWESSNPESVTVENTGKICAKGAGSAIITVTTAEGNKTASCRVIVVTQIDYPIEISFTEYSPETPYWWKTENLNYDNKVIIINSDEEMKNYASFWGSSPLYPEIDFSTHSLLLVSGKSDLGVYDAEAKRLQQHLKNRYELDVAIRQFYYAEVADQWYIKPLLVEKISDGSEVVANITTSIMPLKVCGVDNPLEDLPWLKEIVDYANTYKTHTKIFQCEYRDGIGFLVGLHMNAGDFTIDLTNCEGEVLCHWGGFDGNPCREFGMKPWTPIWVRQ